MTFNLSNFFDRTFRVNLLQVITSFGILVLKNSTTRKNDVLNLKTGRQKIFLSYYLI